MKITPKKKVIPAFMGYVTVVFILTLLVLFIISIVEKNAIVIALPMLVFAIYYVIFNFGFSWFKSAELLDKSTYIEYRVQDVVSVLGKDITTYKIKKIDSIKYAKNDIIIKGDITVQEPMSKVRSISKVKIMDYTEEVKEFFEKRK
jgi:hypothetical protein